MSKKMRIAALALVLGAVSLPALAEDKVADPVVAKVNGEPIYRSEIAHQLQAMGPQAQQIPMQLLYPQLLEKAIATKLIAKEGYAQKLQNDKDVKALVKESEAGIVADYYVRKTITPKITDDKLKAHYDQMVAKFKPEDEVRARHILVQTEAEANDVIKQIKDGGDFAKLATEKSKDTGSAKQGGDLSYFRRGDMVKAFADAAFGMKSGEVSETPVKTEFGYHVIKVEDRRKSSPPPMADVKDQLENQVGQELVAQMVKDMEAKAKIEKFNTDGTPIKVPEAKPDAKK